MISRDLILTITDTNVSLDKTIILYRYDRGITLNITLKSETYDLDKEITKARAIILRPNKKLSATPITDIVKENNKYIIGLTNELNVFFVLESFKKSKKNCVLQILCVSLQKCSPQSV